MLRRDFLEWLGLGGVDAFLRRYWPRDGLWNDCATGATPAELLEHPRVTACWDGIDPAQFWDAHIHLIGAGDNGSGVWVNPHMRQPRHLWQYTQFEFYLNAACADHDLDRDGLYVTRLVQLLDEFPPGVCGLLLAFDYHYDEDGRRREDLSAFHTPNAYAAKIAARHAQRLCWIASVHPYREDALDALDEAVAQGACAVKWLPSAMGMDPAASRCDAFYAALRKYDLPLLVHCGTEYAVHGGAAQHLGNPLRLRRTLEQGVRVIVAHCASLGKGFDLDQGPDGPEVSNFALFARLMDEPAWEGRLFGELSTVTQVNRRDEVLTTLLGRRDWQTRLINASDYPLPGIVPLFSPGYFAEHGWLSGEQDALLRRIRSHNPLLFDFLLKRMLRIDGQGLAPQAFMTRRHFERPRQA